MTSRMVVWRDLCVGPRELRCSVTLMNGQVFSWRSVASNEWIGVVDRTCFGLKQTPRTTMWCCYGTCKMQKRDRSPTNSDGDDVDDGDGDSSSVMIEEDRTLLEEYFHLKNVNLSSLYDQWNDSDAEFRRISSAFEGMRLVRQEPLECLISFICSSNNNIGRIVKMVDSLRVKYGTFICEEQNIAWHAFPTLQQLRCVTEKELRDLGFGYRAKYVCNTVNLLLEHENATDYLSNLRHESRTHVHTQLLKYSGVGPKVADCVALFSLDKFDCIPVDTHVWQLACKHSPSLKKRYKSVTKAAYEEVGTLFRSRYGTHAGWAHQIEFTAHLPQFKHLLDNDDEATEAS